MILRMSITSILFSTFVSIFPTNWGLPFLAANAQEASKLDPRTLQQLQYLELSEGSAYSIAEQNLIRLAWRNKKQLSAIWSSRGP